MKLNLDFINSRYLNPMESNVLSNEISIWNPHTIEVVESHWVKAVESHKIKAIKSLRN